MDIKNLSEGKLEPQEVYELFNILKSLFKEFIDSKDVNNKMNYAYSLYTLILNVISNTDNISLLNEDEIKSIYQIQFCALEGIIFTLKEDKSYNFEFKGISINSYIDVGLKLKDEFVKVTNTFDLGDGFKDFLITLREYYTSINSIPKLQEIDSIFNNYWIYEKNKYPYKDYNDKHKIKTVSGILVDCFGEQKIADFLFKNNINFYYKKDLCLVSNKPNIQGVSKEWRLQPDFYLPDFNIVIEYWGLMVSPPDDNYLIIEKGIYLESNIKYIIIHKYDVSWSNLDNILKRKLLEVGVNV